MSEHPITFNAWSMRALLEGRKTQTRRVLKPPPVLENECWRWKPRDGWDVNVEHINGAMLPCGKPGGYLWVQEGYQINTSSMPSGQVIGFYLADCTGFSKQLTTPEFAKWRARKHPTRATPGRFMYKSLSRLQLKVVRAWVMQVQETSEEDAIAEGIPVNLGGDIPNPTIRIDFALLWNDLHARDGYGWDVNPWVWVCEFEVQ